MPKATRRNSTKRTIDFRPMDHDRMMEIIDLDRITDLGVVVGNVIGLLGQTRKNLGEIVGDVTDDDIREARVGLGELMDYVELAARRCQEAAR